MLRKQSDENNPADWFYLAADRLKAADLIWREEGLTAAGIELLQEAVERYVKGYLVAKGWRLVKTHDLDTLLSDAASFDKAFASFADLASRLTRDFFAQHYPGGDWTDIGQNYSSMREQTGEMVEIIRSNLPQFFPTPTPTTTNDQQ